MEKIAKYRQFIRQTLTEYAAPATGNPDAPQEQLLFDEEHDHYQIMAVGWEGDQRVYFTILHLDILNGKIRIQENNTDFDIAEKLESLGVPKTDIVLAFHAPSMRQFSGYAVT
jgi:hypothetical protein